MLAGGDPAANLADYGIAGTVAALFLLCVIYLYKQIESKQALHTAELITAHDNERDGWLRERAGLETQITNEQQRGTTAVELEQRRCEEMLRQVEMRAAEERRRAEKLADELSRSIQGGQTSAMSAVVEAQRLLRLALGESHD